MYLCVIYIHRNKIVSRRLQAAPKSVWLLDSVVEHDKKQYEAIVSQFLQIYVFLVFCFSKTKIEKEKLKIYLYC